jgi:hypothetical protein
MTLPRAIPLLALLAPACTEDTTSRFEQCEVMAVLDPLEAAPGDAVTATSDLLTEPYDTRVIVGEIDAEIGSIDRTDCTVCDTCRYEADCKCDACLGCQESCAPCVQVLTFAVPALPPGPTTVVIVNAWGSSPPLDLVVLPSEGSDTGAT